MTTRLHLGCFDRPVPGWVNTDISPHLRITKVPGLPWLVHRVGRMRDERLAQHRAGVFRQVRYLDVSKRFPYDSASVSAIFSSHLLEHLPPQVARNCLSECRRVLAPGGVMRVGVPDLDLLVRAYDPEDPGPFVDAVFETAANDGKNRHFWMYNEQSLTAALRSAGFSTVHRRSYREGRCPDLELLDNRPEETLFVEAEV
jgi:SAM-dependent methyltransferase